MLATHSIPRQFTSFSGKMQTSAVQLFALALIAVSGTILCQSSRLQQLQDQFGTNETTEVIDKVKELVRDKCRNASGGDAAFARVEEAGPKLEECFSRLVNVSELQKEIEVAKPSGDLDVVFNKYCGRREQAVVCVTTFVNSFADCLSEQEREHRETPVEMFKSLLKFVCHKDGDQIALFFAEQGPECFDARKDGIQKCVTDAYERNKPEEAETSWNSLPVFFFDDKKCQEFERLKTCIVEDLERCEESTPANLVDSLLKFVKKATPCHK